MQEADNILKILEGTKTALKSQDSVRLKELSDRTVHTASTSQDPDNIVIAVIVYSLSKIIEREKYKEYPGWKNFFKIINNSIDGSIKAIKKNDEKGLKVNLDLIRKSINKLSGNLKKYIKDVFTKAQINKASKIYEHGISMERTASLLGITMFDLAGYSGQSPFQEQESKICKTCSVKDRIKLAMSMFG